MIVQNPEFFVQVIFKLLAINVYISAHNIVCVTEEKYYKPIHCGILACNPKKKEIYVIVVCNNKKVANACHQHAESIVQRIMNICPLGFKIIPTVLRIYDLWGKSKMRL